MDDRKDLFARLPKPKHPHEMGQASSSPISGLPDPSIKPSPIPDEEITYLNSPVWSYARRATWFKFEDQNLVDPKRSLGSIVLTGFPHIDSNRNSSGLAAKAICQELTDVSALRTGQETNEIGVDAALSSLNPSLDGGGPYRMEISPEFGKLVFKISAIDSRNTSSSRVEIPMSGIRRLGRSYVEFSETTAGAKLDAANRKIFEKERVNMHLSHGAFMGEKFAQQDWYIGKALTKPLFELSLYLVTPTLMASAEANAGNGGIRGGGVRYAAPTL